MEQLVGPFDVVEREGNLLDRLELHNLGDFFVLDRRELDEPREARLPAGADRDGAAALGMLRGERRERRGDEAFFIVAGVGEDVFVLDDVDVVDTKPRAVADELDGFECSVADVDTLGESRVSHGACSSSVTTCVSRASAGAMRASRRLHTKLVTLAALPKGIGCRRAAKFYGVTSRLCPSISPLSTPTGSWYYEPRRGAA